MKQLLSAKLLVLFLGLLLQPNLVFASACIPAAQVKKIISVFNIQRWNGSQFNSLSHANLCDAKDAGYKVIESLQLMQQMKNTPEPESDSLVAQVGPSKFFQERIKTIFIEDRPLSETCQHPGVAAYVLRKTMANATFICPEAFSSLSAYQRAVVLIHEARHIDGFPHEICTQGIYHWQGELLPACDTSYADQGSYGVEVGFHIHIAKTSKDPILKQQGRAEAANGLLNHFNELPWDLKAGALLQDFRNNLLFFDGVSATALFQLPSPAIMTSRNMTPTFYFFDGKVKSYSYSAQKLADTQGSFAQDYRQKSTAKDRTEILSVAYEIPYTCFLFTSRLHCEGDTVIARVPLRAIKARALVPHPSDAHRLSILSDEGLLYELPPRLNDLEGWSEELFARSQPKTVILNSASIPLGNLGINKSFQLLQQSKENGWKEVPALRNQRFKQITPHTWSERLEAL